MFALVKFLAREESQSGPVGGSRVRRVQVVVPPARGAPLPAQVDLRAVLDARTVAIGVIQRLCQPRLEVVVAGHAKGRIGPKRQVTVEAVQVDLLVVRFHLCEIRVSRGIQRQLGRERDALVRGRDQTGDRQPHDGLSVDHLESQAGERKAHLDEPALVRDARTRVPGFILSPWTAQHGNGAPKEAPAPRTREWPVDETTARAAERWQPRAHVRAGDNAASRCRLPPALAAGAVCKSHCVCRHTEQRH